MGCGNVGQMGNLACIHNKQTKLITWPTIFDELNLWSPMFPLSFSKFILFATSNQYLACGIVVT